MRRTTMYAYPEGELKKHWSALHAGDCEPYPTTARISKLAKAHPDIAEAVERNGGPAQVAAALEDAWRAFHAGDFKLAAGTGSKLGALGAVVANKAVAIETLYLEKNERKRLELLRTASERGEEATEQLPDDPNVHYTLALVLGRYSQRISILEALAEGHARRIREHLERALTLEPRHSEANIALGLYHAELVKTLGSLAARLTYGASRDAAVKHFKRAIKLTPGSAIAHVEYAHGLILLDSEDSRDEIEKLCSRAASAKPLDMMEQLDIERAKHHCTQA